jgi:hypothetical protein
MTQGKRVAGKACAGKAAAFPGTEAWHSDESQAVVSPSVEDRNSRSGACIIAPLHSKGLLVRVALAFGLSLHAVQHLDGIGSPEDGFQDTVDLLIRELVRRKILFQHCSVSAETVGSRIAGQLSFLGLQLLQVLLSELQVLLGFLAFNT